MILCAHMAGIEFLTPSFRFSRYHRRQADRSKPINVRGISQILETSFAGSPSADIGTRLLCKLREPILGVRKGFVPTRFVSDFLENDRRDCILLGSGELASFFKGLLE